jgi:RNA polymerase sigma factor (sigma-70 family)
MCAPLRGRVLAPYRRQPFFQDLESVVYLQFVSLVEQFDPGRGAGFFTYLAKQWLLKIRTWVRDERRTERREPAWTRLLPELCGDTRLWEDEVDDTLRLLSGAAEASWDGPEHTASLRVVLGKALSELPPRRREVFVLHAVGGYRFREIAAALGAPEATCRQEFRRAQAALKKVLNDSL